VTAGGTVVFLGPTLSLADAQGILPDASYCPPVAQGDVYSLLGAGQPAAIAIVDGVFYQDLPVWHKEILAALEQGVAVYGASSMGALRAAECEAFGMVGVGAIFEDYASGRLVDDDEVAVVHADAEHGWRARTEPMVNLRATMRQAVTDGRMDDAAASRAMKAAKAIWFAERTRPALLEALRATGAPPGEADTLRDVLERAYVDQKRIDAELLLRTLGSCDHGQTSQDRTRTTAVRSHVFEAFLERDRKVEHQGVPLRLEEIARHAALHARGYAELRDRAMDRLLVDELAWLWNVQVTDDDVADEARRLRARLGLQEGDAFERWLSANDVDVSWFDAAARREALARRLRDWMQIRLGKRLVVGPVLDELRVAGRYEQAASAAAVAARFRAMLNPDIGWSDEPGDEDRPDGSPTRAGELVREHIRSSEWRPDTGLARLADEAGFAGTSDLLYELVVAATVQERMREQLRFLDTLFGGGSP
jgi:hypothetical protein